MEFQLLGPPEVRLNGRTVAIGGAIHQLLLSILVSEPRFISTESLIDRLWPADEPDTAVPRAARPRLHELISDLRRALREAGGDEMLLPPQRHGYRADVRHGQVDLLRFHDLRRSARACQEAGELAKAVKQYRGALREWGAEGGPPATEPFAGLTGRWVRDQRDQLRTAYLSDLVECIDLELRLGRHSNLVPELVSLNVAFPRDERIAGQLMIAYHGAGQTADALATFGRIGDQLDEELGTRPGAALQDIHRKVLRQDRDLAEPQRQTMPSTTDSSSDHRKEQVMNETFTNSIEGFVVGPANQISKVVGNVSFGAPPQASSELATRVEQFCKAVRAAQRAGNLDGDAATAVRAEICRALASHAASDDDGEFVAAMHGIRRQVDGAPDLIAQADEIIELALRGAL
ncbi:BTAD domain-containing putative transcriptional regulator [Actinoplanes sp. NPDC049265]|uniref:AfsR/SARP family transcriptional regulator n=1 Tax=Actinoplanes sp. NPDC049265 TaxID=3363902 RepID=UPI003713AD8F